MTVFIDKERLDALVAQGWLRSQRHPEADLWIYNYTEKTQYENHWTPETLACRGLIVDGLSTIRARPFPKFFNYGTPQVPVLPDESFTVTEKHDGSLGILYTLGGEFHVATRGSFVSEQAVEGTRMLSEQTIAVELGTTPLFEIVYPANRIVVDYGDRRELILLAALDNDTGQDRDLPVYTGPSVERHEHSDIASLATEDRPNREGYVVSFESGLRVKIKHSEYVRLHKLITGINARHIWEILKEDGDLAPILDRIPDELYQWIDSTAAGLRDEFKAQLGAAESVFDQRPPTDDRRELAEYFKRSGANTSVLFSLLDGKPVDDLIWKSLRPEPVTPDTIWTKSEATA